MKDDDAPCSGSRGRESFLITYMDMETYSEDRDREGDRDRTERQTQAQTETDCVYVCV